LNRVNIILEDGDKEKKILHMLKNEDVGK